MSSSSWVLGFLFTIQCSHTDILKVGTKLFRIHKRLLIRSEASTFTTMFDLPKSSQAEGETDETPIVLNGDNVEDFEGLMRILYPP